AEHIAIEAARRLVLGLVGAPVEESGVDGVELAFETLHPIAVPLEDRNALRVGVEEVRFHVRQRRRLLPRDHVSPDDAVALLAGISPRFDLGLEIALRRFRRHIDALAADIELPAVIDAAQAVFLIAAEEQRGSPVGAGILDQTNLSRGRPKADEVLAEETDTERRTVGPRQLVRPRSRDPVLPHEVPHRCSWADPAEYF